MGNISYERKLMKILVWSVREFFSDLKYKRNVYLTVVMTIGISVAAVLGIAALLSYNLLEWKNSEIMNSTYLIDADAIDMDEHKVENAISSLLEQDGIANVEKITGFSVLWPEWLETEEGSYINFEADLCLSETDVSGKNEELLQGSWFDSAEYDRQYIPIVLSEQYVQQFNPNLTVGDTFIIGENAFCMIGISESVNYIAREGLDSLSGFRFQLGTIQFERTLTDAERKNLKTMLEEKMGAEHVTIMTAAESAVQSDQSGYYVYVIILGLMLFAIGVNLYIACSIMSRERREIIAICRLLGMRSSQYLVSEFIRNGLHLLIGLILGEFEFFLLRRALQYFQIQNAVPLWAHVCIWGFLCIMLAAFIFGGKGILYEKTQNDAVALFG